jgi:hypothetical protein
VTPEGEVLLAVVERSLGDILGESVVSVPTAGRAAYGCRSASAAYDLCRKGGMAGVIRVGDRLVVSVPQLVGHLLGELDLPIRREGAA